LCGCDSLALTSSSQDHAYSLMPIITSYQFLYIMKADFSKYAKIVNLSNSIKNTNLLERLSQLIVGDCMSVNHQQVYSKPVVEE
jgi:hypothetical protein